MADKRSRAELLDARLDEVEPYWLEIRCACGVGTFYPLRLLARERGEQVRVKDVVRRLRCRTCVKAPTTVGITDDATGGAPSLVGDRRAPWKVDLLP